MKFKIEHSTDDEKEYQAIMDVIRHYELSKPSLNNDFKSPSAKPCQECKGTGAIEGDYIIAKCIKCGGTGKAS